MPFKPHLIHPEDPPLSPEGELQLPAELAALAEQLGDDARHLAARYPATRGQLACGPLAPRAESSQVNLAVDAAGSRRWPKAAVLAGSSLATVLVCLFAIQQFGSESKPGPSALAARPAAPAAPAALSQPVFAPAAAIAVPSFGPTISLGELSGPELEAVFDLWQRSEDDEKQSIAF
jgi:hypothetical protein